MTPSRPWDRAAQLALAVDGRPRPQLSALPAGSPSLEDLFTFMRDAELRFETLRMRIEDRTWTAEGERLTIIETILRHPHDARVTTSEPARGTAGNHEIWISDGEVVRTYAAQHRLGTSRPVRPWVAGLGDPDLPGMSTVHRPLTPLPMETLPEAFVHPAGFCQNVLSTGVCAILGGDVVAGREAIAVTCDHPRGTKVWADVRDHRLRIWVDRETGLIARLLETIGDDVTRDATVVSLEPNAPLPPTAFDFDFPDDATLIY